MIASIILAAGDGTRMNSKEKNKVVIPFVGKPMIIYGLELLKDFSSPIVVVVGAHSESVKDVLKGYDVVFACQDKRLGTGDAVKVGLQALSAFAPQQVLVAYGDHMMFYSKETIQNMINIHQEKHPAITQITTEYENPSEIAFGRIIRDDNGEVIDNVEQKDADEKQKAITEVNAGFYCFDYAFLKEFVTKIDPSPVTGEYYINSLIKMAVADGRKIIGLKVSFEEVGIGINSQVDMVRSEQVFLRKKQNSANF